MKLLRTPRIGIIGCGWITRSIYAPTLLTLKGSISVSAFCDLNETAAATVARQFDNAAVFTNAKAMIAQADLDAVLVLTNERVTASMARLVLEAGLPVFVEKPPAVSSAELQELTAVESRSTGKVYTAFNRRHMPLFTRLERARNSLRRVYGMMQRINREVSSYPHTAIHLIDFAQYFAGSPLVGWEIDFKKTENIWTLHGWLKSGIECELDLIPNGTEFAEFLSLETESGVWDLHFPNSSALVPEGEIIERPRSGSRPIVTRGDKTLPPFESMGFRDCLISFLHEVRLSAGSRHRLASCQSTIRVMEEMEEQVRCVTH